LSGNLATGLFNIRTAIAELSSFMDAVFFTATTSRIRLGLMLL